MEPARLSGATRNSSLDPTPDEIEAGASLPREPEPEPLVCRATDAPAAPPPAVQSLIDKHQLLLGAVTASISALLACSRYSLKTTRFVLKDGTWWRETTRGPRRLSTIPPSLRMWIGALGGYQLRL
jgi:hypothetical protein